MRGIEPRAFHMQSERSTTELHPQMHLCDQNWRRADKKFCPQWGSNSRPSDYETDALPTALPRLVWPVGAHFSPNLDSLAFLIYVDCQFLSISAYSEDQFVKGKIEETWTRLFSVASVAQ